MKYLFTIIRPFYFILFCICFIAFLVLIFPLVIIASFFGAVRGGNFIYTLCRLWSDCVLPVAGIRNKNIYDSQFNHNREYVFITNHISFMDIPIFFKAIRKNKFRVLGKMEMSKIPIFGFLYKNAVVMVDRSCDESRQKSVNRLKAFLKKKISIVICPEGTFNFGTTPLAKFYDGAFRIAIETQTPIQPILLINTNEVLHYRSIFSLKPGLVKSVYIEAFETKGLTLNDLPQLKKSIEDRMSETLIKYGATWIK